MLSQQAGKPLLYHFHDDGRVSHGRHSHQQVNVFRHEHIAQESKAIAASRILEDSEKQIASRGRLQLLLTPVTAKGDEVERAFEVIALQTCRHQTRLNR